MKKRRLPFLVLAIALGSGALSVPLFVAEKAEAAPDPQAVQNYLAELDAQAFEAADEEEAAKKAGRHAQIRKLVEGAAVRAPSGSVINGIEAALAEKLG